MDTNEKNLLSKTIKTETPSGCEICKAKKILPIGEKDFNYSCNDFFTSTKTFRHAGIPINYYQCARCKIIFTNAFDNWDELEYKQYIYNQDYRLTDTPFERERPEKNSVLIQAIYNYEEAKNKTILDFGGGNGYLARKLTEKGFNIKNYDIFYDKDSTPNKKQFDLVTSFEVIEHVPHKNQFEWMVELNDYLNENKESKIILSTEILNENTDISYWYISPRNGHISIHSKNSLKIIAEKTGLNVLFLSNSVQILYKD